MWTKNISVSGRPHIFEFIDSSRGAIYPRRNVEGHAHIRRRAPGEKYLFTVIDTNTSFSIHNGNEGYKYDDIHVGTGNESISLICFIKLDKSDFNKCHFILIK